MAIFRSPHKGFRQNVRAAVQVIHPATGVPISTTPALFADFAQEWGAEMPFLNPETGDMISVANIRGGFFDSEQAQRQYNWTDEERETVEIVLRRTQQLRPDYVQEIVLEHVPAPLPWETYPDATEPDIIEFAPKLKLVPEAVRYERENAKRPKVLAALEAALVDLTPEEQTRAKPLFDVPPHLRGAATPRGVTLGHAPETTASGIVKDTPGLTLKPEAAGISI